MGREVSGSRASWTVSLASQQAQGQRENLTQKIMWREKQEDTWHWPLVSPYTHIGEHTSSTHMHASMYTHADTMLTCMHINSPCWGQYYNGSLWNKWFLPLRLHCAWLAKFFKVGCLILTVMLALSSQAYCWGHCAGKTLKLSWQTVASRQVIPSRPWLWAVGQD